LMQFFVFTFSSTGSCNGGRMSFSSESTDKSFDWPWMIYGSYIPPNLWFIAVICVPTYFITTNIAGDASFLKFSFFCV
jgi:hypothetical protein